MKMMFEIVDTIAERFLNFMAQELKTSKVIEMKSLSTKYTSDVIGIVAFGFECKCKFLKNFKWTEKKFLFFFRRLGRSQLRIPETWSVPL